MMGVNTAERIAISRSVARESAVNIAMAVPAVRRLRLTRPRNSGGFDGSVSLLDRYAFQALRGVERLTGPVRGRSVVEFGPGDHLASGLSVLAAGAARYTALDRFVPNYRGPAAKRWYLGVHNAWADSFPEHSWPAHLIPREFPERYPDRVTTIAGGVEGEDVRREGAAYDIVTSWQVGEHVTDIGSFAELTWRLLAPGGVAVHCVDFGPHDCWRSYDDPLTFLRVPDRLWQLMSSHRGSPNRFRHHEFLAGLVASGLEVDCHDIVEFDLGAVHAQRLRSRFRDMSTESLQTRSVTYVCRRPDGSIE